MSDASQEPVVNGSVAAAVSDLIVRVLRARTGRGPTRAKTTISDDLVACVVYDTLTVGERTLVACGNTDLVLDSRRRYQEVMEDELRTGVERLTGRTVIAVMSGNTLDPDMAIEAFILKPAGAGGQANSA